MEHFRRLVAQVHDIDAESPAQADEIARIRANAANTALRPLGMATAWAPSVTTAEGDLDELLDILGDAAIPDEVENANGACFAGWVRVDDTDIPQRLLAWRDAAIRKALAETLGHDEPTEDDEGCAHHGNDSPCPDCPSAPRYVVLPDHEDTTLPWAIRDNHTGPLAGVDERRPRFATCHEARAEAARLNRAAEVQAAVKDALRAAIPASLPGDLSGIREDAAQAINDPARRLAALHRIVTAASRIDDGLDLNALTAHGNAAATGWDDAPFLVANSPNGGYAIHARDPQYNAQPVIRAYGLDLESSYITFPGRIRDILNRRARELGPDDAGIQTARRGAPAGANPATLYADGHDGAQD